MRFSVTQWSVNGQEMKLKIVFGCEVGQTLVDFFSYTPILNGALSSYNQVRLNQIGLIYTATRDHLQ